MDTDQYKNEDINLFIRTNEDYYLPRFRKMKEQNTKVTWNWAAFIFSAYWFFYRKMYTQGALLLVLVFLLSLRTMAALLSIPLWILVGIFANYLYMKDLEKRALRANAMDELVRSQFIDRNSGTSVATAILAYIAYVVVRVFLL